MVEEGYKIVGDNLGEYSILRRDNTLVTTEIPDKIFAESVVMELNEQHETIKKEEEDYLHVIKAWKELDDEHKEYKEKVKDTLQKHYKLYTNMAVELRHDKYSNGTCHTVLEVLEEIADELGIDLQ